MGTAGSSPIDLALHQTLSFLTPHLRPRATVLEVGCGDGELAARLIELGSRVVAVEPRSEAAAAARERGVEVIERRFLDSGLEIGRRRFSAVLFCRSLHHVAELEPAIDLAAELLEPGGLLLCEEFDLEHIDAATAAWFYDRRRELLADDSLPGPADAEPLTRWQVEHEHEPPLHTGAAMLEASGRRFELAVVERVPYVYRYLFTRLEAGDEGRRRAERLLRDEEAGIAAGALLPVGLRWAGRAARS